MRQETFRIKSTMLKLRRYSSAPPPFFFKLGRLPPCNTITPLPNYNTDDSFRQLIFKFSSFYFLSEIFPYQVPYKLSAIWIFWVLYGFYELKLSRFILNATNTKTPEPAQFQAILSFCYSGSVKYASAAPTTNFQSKMRRYRA